LALALALAVFVGLRVTSSALAGGVVREDGIAAGEVIDDDVILTGDDVVLEGTVNGDVLAVGPTVTVTGAVNGSLIVAGQTVSIPGQVEGSVYAAGLSLELGPSSSIGRSLYYVGFSLATQSGSLVGRDLVGVSLGARLAGEVGRDLRAIIGPLELVRLFMEAVGGGGALPGTSAAPRVEPLAQGVDLPDQGGAGGVLASARPVVGGGEMTSPLRWPAAQLDPEDVRDWGLARLRELVTLLIVGLLALWLVPSLLSRGVERVRAAPLPAAGYGALGLVLAFNLFAVAILLAALLLVIGLWLGVVTFWDLAFILWGVGYSAIGLAVSVFALFVFFGSKVIASYLAGTLILERLAPQVARYKILALFLGLVLYVLLRSIPILGWAIGVIVTIVGLGAAWLAVRDGWPRDRRAATAEE
jgi:hypothetical protein